MPLTSTAPAAAPARATAAVRVLVLERDDIYRAGVRDVLEADGDLRVVPRTAVTLGPSAAPAVDVVVLGCEVAERHTVTAVAQLRRDLPGCRVLVLARRVDVDRVLDLVRAGARGVLLKSQPAAEVLAAVRSVSRGGAVLSPTTACELFGHLSTLDLAAARSTVAKVERLSKREREVMERVADGLANDEIAQQLHVSHGTVKAALSRSLATLGCRNRVQAAVVWHSARLLGGVPAS